MVGAAEPAALPREGASGGDRGRHGRLTQSGFPSLTAPAGIIIIRRALPLMGLSDHRVLCREKDSTMPTINQLVRKGRQLAKAKTKSPALEVLVRKSEGCVFVSTPRRRRNRIPRFERSRVCD